MPAPYLPPSHVSFDPRLHQNPEITIGFVFLQRGEVLRADQLAVVADKVQTGRGATVKLDGRAVLGCLKADAVQKDVRCIVLAINFDPVLKIPVRSVEPLIR